jgi:putative ABC transport system permease protein
MTRHLLRLIWNRKRSNFLIMVEILFAFLVLEGVMLMATYYANNQRQPLGFSIDRVWGVRIDTKEERNDDKAVKAAQMAIVHQLFNAVRDLPQVEAACGGFTTPYANASWTSDFRTGGREIDYAMNTGTDECDDVYGITLTRGRWFDRGDDGAAYTPVVVNEQFAREVFGDTEPINKIVPKDRDLEEEKRRAERGDPAPKPMRVVGVMQDFRQHGEYAAPENYVFQRVDMSAPDASPERMIIIKVRAGTPMAFEETLAERLQSVAKDWSFGITVLTAQREDKLLSYTGPLTLLAIVAGFLLLMVGLGLTGVVWQNVTQRIREIGLRRAKGARIENIHRQILGELIVMTSLALLVGVLLLAQLPVLPLPPDLLFVPGPVFVLSIVLSVLAIYALTLLCGWYPARLATKIQPAEALHYE